MGLAYERRRDFVRKEWLRILVLLVIIIVLFPWTVLRWYNQSEVRTEDIVIRVLMPDGQVKSLDLEDYLVGVVAAEMPAEFEEEALKAQAIAARTYAAQRISQRSGNEAGYDVDTTVNSQVWISEAKMKEKWNLLSYWRYHSKIEKAVTATKDQVLVAGGQYIDAFFHSSTGRKPTERAEDVWSSSRPYLQNVAAGEEKPTRYVKTYTFTPSDLYQKVGHSGTAKAFTEADFVILSETAAGRAKVVRVLGKNYTGAQIRTALGLASTDMEITITPQQLKITTYGNGHAVGMSQYGANDLAKAGKTCEEILQHYYPGTQLLNLTKA
ncbi:stage II sporulation protein D [Desulfitobacterium hafniense DP7]|uniref:Stage II sporulation protein D n=1 Tax=Desulfitobacterium hafniense DP7 TaxID=537010 RepID=G9XTC7_DESHA|nr:stage II sporulation protein D [Desulfitobacterium hafniense DP7]